MRSKDWGWGEKSTYQGLSCSCAVKGEIHTSTGQFRDDVLDRLVQVSGIKAVSGSQGLGFWKLLTVDVNSYDSGSTCYFTPNYSRKAYTPQAKDSTSGTRGDLQAGEVQSDLKLMILACSFTRGTQICK